MSLHVVFKLQSAGRHTEPPAQPVVCLTFKVDAAVVKTTNRTRCAPNDNSGAALSTTPPPFEVPPCDVTATASGRASLTLAWASAMKKSSVRALCRGSSTVTLVGSWLRPFSIVMKSCHSGRSSVSSQALRRKHSDSQRR